MTCLRSCLRYGLYSSNVLGKTAHVQQIFSLLAWNVGSHIPGVGVNSQRHVRYVRDLLSPSILFILLGFDGLQTLVSLLVQSLYDPLALHFQEGRSISQRCRCLWSINLWKWLVAYFRCCKAVSLRSTCSESHLPSCLDVSRRHLSTSHLDPCLCANASKL